MTQIDETPVRAPSEPLCLEFVNTVENHASARPGEWLQSYDDLAAWTQRAGLASEAESDALRRAAAERPAEARRALARAIALREAIYRIFVALIAGQPAPAADLATVNTALSGALGGPRLAVTPSGYAWGWPLDRSSLDWPARAAALSAAELLTSDERTRVGQCADEYGCGWLFLDTSRNRSRRWCSMNDCGNRAKQRRHARRLGPARDNAPDTLA
jgi:predicted RNA-binding Zn ribbon-like protein